MPDDAQYAIFSQRAGGPGLLMNRKSVMRRIVLNVRRVDQGDQQLDIEQKGHQGSSSRN